MCGIFGQINKHHTGKFNYPAFTTLGITNDTRGGDSCGIYIDKVVRYGTEKHKLFYNFFVRKDIDEWLSSVRTCKIALGHCRKASVGAIDEEHAQPVVLYNDEGNVEFVLIHNGTIVNYKDLARKYIPNVDIKGMTDSQVMARIFYYKGYNCLSEYIGGAVFVIADYRNNPNNPEVFLFKGCSKLYPYSTTEVEERPLFYTTSKSGTVLFSSIYSYLLPFSGDEDVFTLSPNYLCKYDNGSVVIVKEFDRGECSQNMSTVSTYAYSWDDLYGHGKKGGSTIVTLNGDSGKSSGTTSGVSKNTLFYSDEGYKMNNRLITGVFQVCNNGVVDASAKDSRVYYFINGIALKNYKCYSFMTKLANEFGVNLNDIGDAFPDLLEHFNMFPNIAANTNQLVYTIDDHAKLIPFEGKVQYLGDDVMMVVKNGKIVETVKSATSSIIDAFYTTGQQFSLNMDAVDALIGGCDA